MPVDICARARLEARHLAPRHCLLGWSVSVEPWGTMGHGVNLAPWNGGVVDMIEVIQSDFARLESDTAAGEEEA